jgi:hypothetical protein
MIEEFTTFFILDYACVYLSWKLGHPLPMNTFFLFFHGSFCMIKYAHYACMYVFSETRKCPEGWWKCEANYRCVKVT